LAATRWLPGIEHAQTAVAQDNSFPELEWRMVTSWPPLLGNLSFAAQLVAERIAEMTNGKFKITVYPAGELVPALEVMNHVSTGEVEMGHTAAYYYTQLSPANAFGCALPFGLTAMQQNAWLYEHGGLQMLQAFYEDRFNLIQFPAGNTGVQMGGWFNKEITSLADLAGLRMRTVGLTGRVMAKLGVETVALGGGEIFQALVTGEIDAGEWVGPYDDQKLGLHKAARYYYYPGWWEPCTVTELQISLPAWQSLPQEYQIIVRAAAYEANLITLARYDAGNPAALQQLYDEADITLLAFPQEVLVAAETATFELFEEISASDADFAAILPEWVKFRDSVQAWHGVSELAYLNYSAWSLRTVES
jgi:TRAP-type mannitol/chloroaromatic compound transport system substrate-binding protein